MSSSSSMSIASTVDVAVCEGSTDWEGSTVSNFTAVFSILNWLKFLQPLVISIASEGKPTSHR